MIFLASLRKELFELTRTNCLLIMMAVLLAFGLTSPVVAKYTPEIISMIPEADMITIILPEPTLFDSISQFMKNTYQFGFLLAILLTMGSVAKEKEMGTAAMVLSKPLPRWVFILSKFTALALAFLGCLLVASLGAYYYTVILFSTPQLAVWLQMTIALWCVTLVYVAITLLFSTLLRSSAAAAGLAFGIMIIFSLLGTVPVLEKLTPGYLLTWAGRLFTPDPISGWYPWLISLGIILLSLVAACMAIERQEI